MFTIISLILNMVITTTGHSIDQKSAEINWSQILPDTACGWQRTEDKEFNRENLYAYIDGGAELYLSYGFRSLFCRTYARREQPDLIVEIFDMANSSNAFGIFAHFRESVDSTFGQGSQYIAGSLLFWKDHYLISLLGSPETDESRQQIFELARQIDHALAHKGALPALLTLLPADSLIQSSIRYFHHYIWLNTYYYIADQNILHIDQNSEAMLARYKQGEGGSLLLVVIKYPDKEKANQAKVDFIKSFLPEAAGKMAVQVEDRTWISYRLKGTILSIVFNGKNQGIADQLLTQVENKINNFSESK
jgi:hypothetical protein